MAISSSVNLQVPSPAARRHKTTLCRSPAAISDGDRSWTLPASLGQSAYVSIMCCGRAPTTPPTTRTPSSINSLDASQIPRLGSCQARWIFRSGRTPCQVDPRKQAAVVRDVELGSTRWENVPGVAWLGKEGQAARLRKELWGEAVDFSFRGRPLAMKMYFASMNRRIRNIMTVFFSFSPETIRVSMLKNFSYSSEVSMDHPYL